MPTPFRVLIIDDSEKDAHLIGKTLRKNWPALAFERVDTAAAMREALKVRAWDCIFCDVVIPGFGASAALEIFKQGKNYLPFIVVSGVIGIEDAVSLMKAGAHDFVRKDDLARLVPAMEGAIRDVANLRRRKDVESRLRVSEERLRGAIESLQEGFGLFDADDRLVTVNDVYQRVNPAAQEFLKRGMKFEDLIRANVEQGMIPEAIGREEEFIRERLEQHRNLKGPIIRQFINGSWYIIKETRTPEGGTAVTFTDITDLKRSERALNESGKTLRAVVESSPGAIIIKDLEGRNLIVNKTFCDWYGIDKENIIGKSVRDFLAKENVDLIIAQEHKVVETGTVIGEERQVTYPDGVTRDVFTQKFPVFGPDGDIMAIGTVIDDITEQKKAKESLQKSQAQLLEAQLIAHVGNWSRDLKTDQVTWSDETFRIYGYEPGKFEPTYEKFLKIIHPDDKKIIAALIEKATSQKEPASLEYRIVRPDGEVRWAFVRAFATVDDEGNPVSLTGTVQDITESKEAEAALRKVNRALRTLSECNQALIRVNSEEELFSDMCRIVVEHGGFRFAWIGLKEEDEGKSVRPAAQHGFEDSYLETQDITWADTERGRGPSGTSIRTGKPAVIRDIPNDPNFKPWRAEAVKRGCASSVSLPLFNEAEVVGVFNIYSGDKDAFDDEEVQLLEELAQDISFGIQTLRQRELRRRAEEALQESEQRYMRLVENTPAGIWQITSDGETVYINDALSRMFELDDPEEGVGRFYADFVTPESAEQIRKQLPERQKGLSSQYEIEIVGKKGGKRRILLTGSPLFSPDGELMGRIATLIDITERKQVEEALGKKTRLVELLKQITISVNDTESVNEALRTCIESICAYTGWPVGHAYILADDGTGELVSSKIWHLDRPERFKTFRRITEKTRFAPGVGMVGRVLASKLPAWIPDVTEDSNFIRAKPAKNIGVKGGFAFPVLTGETVVAVLEFFFLKAVGLDLALLEVMVPIGKQLGRVVERKQAEAELRKLSAAVEQSPASIIITDTDGTIEYVNPKFTEITGYSAEEAIGQTPRLLKSGETPDAVYERLWADITAGKEWRGTLRNKRKDGTVYLAGVSISPILAPDGAITHFISAGQDITQKVEDERHLKQAEKMESIGGLAGGIAHDFNNMLLPILSLTDMTRKALPEDSRDRLRLDKVIEAATRAKDLVARILAFSRQEDAKQENIDIHETIHETMDLLRSTLPTSVKIKQRLKRDTGTVFADRAQMASVLLNLASNAADAMDGKTGEMTVSLSPLKVGKKKARSIPGLHEGKHAKLAVKDNGCGMDEETLARVMDPFFTTKPVGEGTGLGLSMVHGIVSKHGGAVHIVTAPGKGTTVEVYLPLVEGEAGPDNRDGKDLSGHQPKATMEKQA